MIDFGLPEEVKTDVLYDVIILGAGSAGLTAAIYASRSLLKTLVIDPAPAGGLALTTELIENYPGFPDGILGPQLMAAFRRQAEKFKAEIIEITPVNAVRLSGQEKEVVTDRGTFRSKAIIIATGRRYKEIGIKGENEYKGKGVSYCATCDAPLFRGKDVAVVASGSLGIQEGLRLLKFVNSVILIGLPPRQAVEPYLLEKIKDQKNISLLLHHRLLEIYGERTVKGVKIEDLETGEVRDIRVDGVFIFASLTPNSELFEGIEKDRHGFILADDRTLKTNLPGVYVAGDVRSKNLRQIATAVGDGALAAHGVKQYLHELEREKHRP
ncbi:MAG TPA: FAD-dependent oxidoreductase [Candidatus Saccharicenans sp.]|nr:FAD-dependent oxidoreductase [Candidatus Saccharicenans sp.]